MIPINLEDCFAVLTRELVPEDITFIKQNEDNVILLHHSLGQYLRNKWGLWEDHSDLKTYFQELGLFHPDDMSGLILRSFHRHLNNKPLEIEIQIKSYQDFWNRNNIAGEK